MTDTNIAPEGGDARRRTAEEQARILVHALPFLRRYAGATVVVKYGGHAMGEEHLAASFGSDIALLKQMKAAGIDKLLVSYHSTENIPEIGRASCRERV